MQVIMRPREGGRYEPRLCGSLQRLILLVKSFMKSSDGSDGGWEVIKEKERKRFNLTRSAIFFAIS